MLNIYNQRNQPEEETPIKGKKVAAVTKPADFRTYVDPTGELRSKELERGIWVVSHRVWIYRLIVLVLILLNVFLWLTGLIKWGGYIIDWQAQTRMFQQLSRFPSYLAINKRLAPDDIQILDPVFLPGGVDKYDVIAEATNPNDRYVVQFEYRFLINGSSTEKGKALLLPGETKPIVILGLQGYAGGEIEPVVDRMRWTRLNPHVVADPLTWQKERLNFVVSDFVFTPAEAGGATANALTFDILNNSPYNYVEPEFYIGLYNGPDNLVGLMPLTIKDFKSLDTYHADVRNFVRGLHVSEIKLFPLLNVYDKEVYRAATP